MPYFEYSQNNSGGVFIHDKDVAEFVIIEAPDAEAANTRAEEIGIYFDGCEDGRDCRCCGDRWHHAWNKGFSKPMLYGEPLARYQSDYGSSRESVYVYHADGQFEAWKLGKKTVPTYQGSHQNWNPKEKEASKSAKKMRSQDFMATRDPLMAAFESMARSGVGLSKRLGIDDK